MGEWQRLRIGDFLHRAKSPVSLRDDEEYQLVTVRMHHNGVTLREKKKGKLIGSNMYRVKAGQFILSGIDARQGAFGVIPEELDGAIVTNDFWYFNVDDAVVSRDFFLWFTTTPLFLDACIKSSEGTTNRRRLQAERFFNFSFNFPGVSEQRRLAERFISFDKTHSALKNEFEAQTTHFKQLRQAVLQEAVEGKLTADWRRRHPVVKGNPQHDSAALLEQVKVEKERLVKEGEIRKEKPLPTVSGKVNTFDFPTGWARCAMCEIIYCYRGHNPPKLDFKYEPQEGYVRFIQITDFKTDDRAVFVPISRGLKYVKRGEILMAAYRHIGKISREVEGAFNVALCKIIEVKPMHRDFVEKLIGSSFIKGELLNASHRAHIPSMHTDHLLSLIVPLPPLAEQQAIVARVDSLMATIDALEAQVTERKEQAQQLMQAVLREAFAGGATDKTKTKNKMVN